MRTIFTAAALLATASLGGIAIAQTKPVDPTPVATPAIAAPINDARSLASDREVGEARRAYRAACQRHESFGFCDCVTAGVAQALMPAEVRIAARTFGERIPAQGDAFVADESDRPEPGASSATRIAQVEAHYANTCAQFR